MNHLKLLLVMIGGLMIIFSSCSEESYVTELKKANELIHEGKRTDSTEKLEQAVKQYQQAYSYAIFALEKEYDALLNLGILYAYSGFFKKCTDVMKHAYDIQRNEVSLYYYWGMCYVNQAQISIDQEEMQQLADKALSIYQLGMELDQTDERLHYGLGILHGFILNEHEVGIEYLNTAHTINPNDVNTLFGLANLTYQIGRKEESIQYYQLILDVTDEKSTHYQKARNNLDKIK